MRPSASIAAATLLLFATPVLAQNDVCMDNNGNVDRAATIGWQNFQSAADPHAMQQLVGTWYNELPSPEGGQMAYRYQTLEPNGLFTMESRICDSSGACGDYPAHGFWAAQQDRNGVFTLMIIVSDTQVTNYCSLAQAVLQGGVMQSSLGQSWQRVQ